MALTSPFRLDRRVLDRRIPQDRRSVYSGNTSATDAGSSATPPRESISAVTEVKVHVDSNHAVVEARQHGRALAGRIGFGSADRAIVAAAIHELARNILLFAQRGDLTIALIEHAGRKGLRIIADDGGPGIADLRGALQDGFSTTGRMGIGLPGVKRLVDEFVITSEPDRGTTVTVIKWKN